MLLGSTIYHHCKAKENCFRWLRWLIRAVKYSKVNETLQVVQTVVQYSKLIWNEKNNKTLVWTSYTEKKLYGWHVYPYFLYPEPRFVSLSLQNLTLCPSQKFMFLLFSERSRSANFQREVIETIFNCFARLTSVQSLFHLTNVTWCPPPYKVFSN